MKRLIPLLVICTIMLGLGLPHAAAQDEMTKPAVYVHSIWARPAMVMDMGEGETEGDPMATEEADDADMGMEAMVTSAAYMQIENPGEAPLTLVGAAAEVAEAVEIHEVTMVDNVMQMRPVEGGIEIPAGESVALEPGGYHVMFIGVHATIEAGDAFPITLTFAYADDMTMDVVVAAIVLEEPPAESPIVIYGAWARAVVGGEGVTSAAYLTLDNRGDDPDRLISAYTDAATATEIHEMKMDGEVMQMRPVEGGVEIPAGETHTVALAPGGLHVMMIGVPEDLVVGEALVLTLTFESGLELQLAVPIMDAMQMMDSMGGMN